MDCVSAIKVSLRGKKKKVENRIRQASLLIVYNTINHRIKREEVVLEEVAVIIKFQHGNTLNVLWESLALACECWT